MAKIKNFQLYQLLFLRLVIILAVVACVFFLYKQHFIYTTIFFLLIFIALLAELFYFVQNVFQFYDKTISAILNDDFSADFSKHSGLQNYKSLFKLYNTLKANKQEQVSKDIVYSSILNNIETAVLILQKKQGEEERNIFFINDYFSGHFRVPKVTKWHYLKNMLPSLCTIIEERDFDDIKTSIQIRIDKEDMQTFILQASKTVNYNDEYYIVLMDSIQNVIDKKEKEAWVNLMKVISHELMNSVTPIRSLAQNLQEIAGQEKLTDDDLDDIRQSVNTMIHRSDHLQGFIESYRKLAMLPSPVKEKTELTALIGSVLQIMAPLLKNAGISIDNKVTDKRWLMVDRLQIEQVLINLLTNSMYALEDKVDKKIEIAAEFKNKRVFITISDTGSGIDAAIEDKIFLPFFTTRKQGAGIGLTLSKNIVEAHNGYLIYNTDGERTTFLICLVE
jgi:nitrogen fixation/metabolism regulation signal transduction histidine kinase